MNESEVLRELSRKTGLPESDAASLLRGLRECVRDGAVDVAALFEAPAAAAHAAPNPEDPRLVDDLIARARRHPLGIEFLLSGLLASVAIVLGVHAFTVEAARRRLRNEQAAEAAQKEVEPVETTTV